MIVVSTPDAAREVFKFNDRVLSGRSMVHIAKKIPSLDNSMIAVAEDCDESWRFLRGLGHMELFSSQAVESSSSLRFLKAKEMLEYLGTKEGQKVKMGDVLFATLANTMTTIMVSREMTSFDNAKETQEFAAKLVQFGIPGLGDLYPRLSGFDFGSRMKVRTYVENSKKLWGDIIEERRGRKDDVGHRKDFLDVLLQHSWDDYQIRNLLTEFFLSSGTMSVSLEWVMAELASNPKALTKLREELDEAVGGSVLRETELTKLPYLQACIKETFRMHPPVPFLIPRSALQDCKIMSYDVPKDSIVIINAYAIGRDPNVWEDPSSFKPERFLENGIDLKGTNYELLPFGSGRRNCAGIQLGLKEVQLLIASLVLAFDWCLPDETDPDCLNMNDLFGLTLRMEKPLTMVPKRRMALDLGN